MDQQAYEAAKVSYQSGDWALAASQLAQAKRPGEVYGAADHLLGNCLMKLGMFKEASDAYAEAMRDVTYGKSGALATNRGRALVAAGQNEEAIKVLRMALDDPDYPTPYKAFMTLGNAELNLGNFQEAGVAFRNAAIDERNPDPAKALIKLGGCFMKMNRATDAIEAYRTALDFSTPAVNRNEIYADLGRSYVAANRMNEAIDSFNQAISDGTYVLDPASQASYDVARKTVQTLAAHNGPSETDSLLEAAGYMQTPTGSYDPLDPMGQSGEIMPSPDDTGFFSISEEDLVNAGKKNKKRKGRKNRKDREAAAPVKEKKKKSGVAKFFIALVIILVVLAAAAAGAFYLGYGWPTQQQVVESLFKAKTDGSDTGAYIAGSVSAPMRKEIDATIPAGATVKVSGVDQEMMKSQVLVTATLSQGGKQTFVITMVRDGITWKVVKVEPEYISQEEPPSLSDAADAKPAEQQNPTDAGADNQTGTADNQTQQNAGGQAEGGNTDRTEGANNAAQAGANSGSDITE